MKRKMDSYMVSADKTGEKHTMNYWNQILASDQVQSMFEEKLMCHWQDKSNDMN